MTKKLKEVDMDNIGEVIKAATETQIETETAGGPPAEDSPKENNDMPKSTTTWGGFKIEIGATPPQRKGGTSSKYDWAAFPAPKDPADPNTWPSVFVPDIGAKTLYQSIKTYRDKLQKEGKEAPEFSCSVSKEPKGVRVFRTK